MLITDTRLKISSAVKDPEAVIRMVARAVIRRVQTENPAAHGGDLRLRLGTANPFGQDEGMVQIWHEEMTWALQSRNFNLN